MFDVLKPWLLQQRETQASFVYIVHLQLHRRAKHGEKTGIV